ncbi:S-layer homology domain-containing protein [Saccharibacillus sacchari]|uniref:S-layer homology domain-containing protein n=1 Tax=Saccharibacillus sacchari TaxID=456493 RepID=UPI001FE22728|nr:S-layer homology domain-containing protein [Saccharibacillus sacchari]
MKKEAGLHKGFKLAMAAMLVLGSLTGLGTQATEAAPPQPVPGGVGTGLISWVDVGRSTDKQEGEKIAALTDLAPNVTRTWTSNSKGTAAAYKAASLNFNAAYTGYDYFRTLVSGEFAASGVDEREVFSVQSTPSASTGYPWELGGGYTAASRYLSSGSITSYFGSKTHRTITNSSSELDMTQVDLTKANILNVSSIPDEWTLNVSGGQALRSTTNEVDFSSPVTSPSTYYFGAAHNSVNRGPVSEMIVFDHKLSDTERQQVNSYLAFKYGITLKNNSEANVDYLASDLGLIWDASDNLGYGYRITGIGRDDASGLEQKQSKAQDAQGIVTLALGTAIAGSNEANVAAFAADQSFYSFSDNGGSTGYTVDLSSGSGSSLLELKHMPRIHKVEATGDWTNEPITLKADGAVQQSGRQYYLISSAAANMSNAQLHPLNANGEVTLSSGSLPDGTFFTFAYVDTANLVPGDPGGVASPVLWMRSDRGIQQNSGGAVAEWKDQSPSGNDASQPTSAAQPTYWDDASHNINFNPVLDFANDYLTLDVNKLPLGKKARTIVAVAKSDTVGNSIGYVIGWGTANGSNTAVGMLRNESRVGLTPMNSSTDRSQTMYSVLNLMNDDFPHEQFLTWTGGENGDAANQARLYSKMKRVEDDQPNGLGQDVPKKWDTGTLDGAVIGKVIPASVSNYYWDGTILDIIVYDRVLTDLERQQVSTYLAIKHGYTIAPGNPDDTSYLDSQGNKIWNSLAAVNGAYTNRITSIGRDDASDLKQKQSKAQESGALVTLALGNEIKATNSANLNEFATDLAFFTFGDNGASADYTQSIQQAQDVSLKRMERLHKVDTSGWTNQDVTLQADIAQRDASQPEQYYLVVSSQEDLGNASFFPLDENGRITLSGNQLSEGNFFTFAHADKTALGTKVSSVDNHLGTLKQEDYTPESWTALQTKLTAAKNQLDNPQASQAQIDQALKELSETYEGLEPLGATFDNAVLEKDASGSRIAITLDRSVTFDGQTPAGFTVRVGNTDVPIDPANIIVDPLEPTRVLIELPAELDLTNVDQVGVSYDSASGNLEGLNGQSVGSFSDTAYNGFGAELTITRPSPITGKPAFTGTADLVTESLTVVIRDAQGHIITGAGGLAGVDPITGEWSFDSEELLPPGTYTVEATAVSNNQTAVKIRTFTVLASTDKTALQQRYNQIVGENLNGASYTPATWNELQQALNEAAQVLNDKTATQAQVDAALSRLNAARSGLALVPTEPSNPTTPVVTPSQPSVPPVVSAPPVSTTAPTKQIISVDVASGSADLSDITKVELERTTNADGSLSDLVAFTPTKAQEAIDKALAKNDPTARILIPDPSDAVSEVNVNIPKETVALLQKNAIDLEIHNPNGTVIVPASSLQGWTDDLYFRLVPIKQQQERQQVENRAVTEQVVRELSGNEAARVVSRPMTIETNISSRPVTLVLPLDGTKLPANATERESFLRELGVYIEHSDGTKEVVRGEVVTMDEAAAGSNKLGLRFGIQKFSNFTIVHLGESQHHEAYIQGYTDGTLRPDNKVIRAEMAAMLTRLGVLASPTASAKASAFSDSRSRYWAHDYIGQVVEAGWMKGYIDESFKPDGAITREEMASIAFNYLGLSKGDASGSFPDVRANGWSGGIIAAVQSKGIMTGYPDGTFRPQQELTRSEAVTILNRLFERGPLHGAPTSNWPDVQPGHWAYADLMEAALDHAYADRDNGGEEWTSAN